MGRAKYLLLGLLLALPILGGVILAQAQSFRSGNNVTVANDTTVNGTLFASGRTINIDGTVNGDLFCAGQNVNVSAAVNGDVLCAGQNVTVSGKVKGDVRLAGQNVTLGGSVGGNATVVTQTFTQNSSASIAGDLSVAGQDVTLNGPVGRDVAASAADVHINGDVTRNVQANVETLTLGSGAKVGGDIKYASTSNLTQASGATVAGSVTRTTPKPDPMHEVSPVVFWFASALYVFVTFLLAALVLVLLIPRTFHVAAEAARKRLGKTLLVGLVASIVAPVILVLLVITVVGIPLALLLGLIWLVLVLLSGAFSSYLLGRMIFRGKNSNAILTMLVGAAILLLLAFVPFVGAITSLLSLWVGLGMLLHLVHRSGRRPHYDMDEAEPAPATAAKIDVM